VNGQDNSGDYWVMSRKLPENGSTPRELKPDPEKPQNAIKRALIHNGSKRKRSRKRDFKKAVKVARTIGQRKNETSKMMGK